MPQTKFLKASWIPTSNEHLEPHFDASSLRSEVCTGKCPLLFRATRDRAKLFQDRIYFRIGRHLLKRVAGLAAPVLILAASARNILRFNFSLQILKVHQNHAGRAIS